MRVLHQFVVFKSQTFFAKGKKQILFNLKQSSFVTYKNSFFHTLTLVVLSFNNTMTKCCKQRSKYYLLDR